MTEEGVLQICGSLLITFVNHHDTQLLTQLLFWSFVKTTWRSLILTVTARFHWEETRGGWRERDSLSAPFLLPGMCVGYTTGRKLNRLSSLLR